MYFDAGQHEPWMGFETVPDGWHKAIIRKTNCQATKDQSGGMLGITYEVIEGPSAGKTLMYFCNLWNQSPQAVEAAHKQLSALCRVIGVAGVNIDQNAQDNAAMALHNIPHQIHVGTREGNQGGKFNTITQWRDQFGNDPVRAQPAGAPPMQAIPGAPAMPGAPGGMPPMQPPMQGQPQASQQPPTGAPPYGTPQPQTGYPAQPAPGAPFPAQTVPGAGATPAAAPPSSPAQHQWTQGQANPQPPWNGRPGGGGQGWTNQ